MTGPGLSLKKRLLALLVIFTLIVAALLAQVALIQFIQGEELQKKAYIQQNESRLISPIRGTIYDTNGKELAISAQVGTVTGFPNSIDKEYAETIANGLAPILEMDRDDIYKLLTKKTNSVTIKKKIDREVEDKVRKWIAKEKITGIKIDEDAKRYYPDANLAAHVIGFTGTDNQGLQGIEAVMEKYLKGVPGKILSGVDANGSAIPYDSEMRIDAQDGLNVVLTIDKTIQYLATKTLEKAIDDYKVKRGAIAIVMDPRNGDILALVSKPDYDLNKPFAAPAGLEGIDAATWDGTSTEGVSILNKTVWRNKAISDTYEPGSTFKSFTAAAGLEEGAVKPDTITSDAPIKVAGWPKPIYCWRRGREHGTETFTMGVVNSCNPVFVKVAQSLGIDRFYSYLHAFGFYDKTGIDLYGEGKPLFQSKPKEIDMAVASFGQRFTITPIQLITGYSALINGGKLMKPRLVKDLTDQDGNVVKKFEPEVVRTVISKQTSDMLRGILEQVVANPNGTGNNAYVKGYRIGGKTGTSETTEQGVYTASFVAFAPADNPVVSVFVALFDPEGESHMGGVIAAPTAGKLIEDVLNYLQVERRYTEEDLKSIAKEVLVPEVRNMTVEEAVKSLKQQGLAYKLEGNGNNKSMVLEQIPKPDASIPQNSVVLLYTYKPEKQPTVKMPDLLKKSISEATEALKNAGLNIRVSGSGIAVKQEYAPGMSVPKGEVIEVDFKQLDNMEVEVWED